MVNDRAWGIWSSLPRKVQSYVTGDVRAECFAIPVTGAENAREARLETCVPLESYSPGKPTFGYERNPRSSVGNLSYIDRAAGAHANANANTVCVSFQVTSHGSAEYETAA